jgi:hypothetical protein
MENLEKILKEITDNISKLKEGKFWELKLNELMKKYENEKEKIKKYFDVSDNPKITDLIGEECFDDIIKVRKEFETSFNAIDNGLNDLLTKIEKEDNFKDFSIAELANKLDLIYNKEFNIPKLPPENKEHDIDIENINTNSNVLSNPAIIKDGDKLICNYKKITAFKGPICPDLYSQPITLNIISLSDETIKAEIIEIEDNNISEKDNGENSPNAAPPSPDKPNGEEVKEKIDKELKEIVDTEGEKNGNFEVKEDNIEHIEELERKDIENNIYMRLEKSEIKSKNEIQIKITIPENINKEKKEIQIIKRKLKLTSTSSNANGEVEIEMKILTVPIELLISCENYKLEYINGVYHLKTYQLFSKEKIIFRIQNYLKGEENIIKARMEYLEGNTPGVSIDLKEEKDKLIVTLPNIINEPKRVNYK